MTIRPGDPISRRRALLLLGTAGVVACTPADGRPTLVTNPTTTAPGNAGQILREPVESDPIAADDLDQLNTAIDRSIVATAAIEQIEIFDEPDGSITHELISPTPTGGPLLFLTELNEPDWHKVLLPMRPNGSTGWVRDSDVDLSTHQYRIAVDLAEFRVRVFERGVVTFDAVAGVAANNTPTPGGRYYLTELLAPLEPDSIYGSFAYGLSGFSETFETFNGGPGQLGIHGTNNPETLGTPVSSGCIRLHNDDIARLVEFLPLGVPVEVA